MPAYAAFLRAVNVGGTGKLPMADLCQMVLDTGADHVKTYIASGNVVFSHPADRSTVQKALADQLNAYAGKPVGLFVRTLPEIKAHLDHVPFDGDPKQIALLLVDTTPSSLKPKHQKDEQITIGTNVIYVHYPSGMGRSRLTFDQMQTGTARNLNTMRKMRDLLTAIPD